MLWFLSAQNSHSLLFIYVFIYMLSYQRGHIYKLSTVIYFSIIQFINVIYRNAAVQFSRCHVRFFATPWIAARQASLSTTNSQSLFKLMSIQLVMPSNHLFLCRPLLLPPSIFPSIRVFSNELVLRIRWPKYWSFSFIISPSTEYSGLISFRMDWLDLLTLHHSLVSFTLISSLRIIHLLKFVSLLL